MSVKRDPSVWWIIKSTVLDGEEVAVVGSPQAARKALEEGYCPWGEREVDMLLKLPEKVRDDAVRAIQMVKRKFPLSLLTKISESGSSSRKSSDP